MYRATCKYSQSRHPLGLHLNTIMRCRPQYGLYQPSASALTQWSNAGGRIEGEVLVNGHPQEAATFARISGYVSACSSDSTVMWSVLSCDQ